MNIEKQQEKAKQFRALHRGALLILVNAWDVISARIIESLGFPAVATTSAGVAWAAGYADGERISREEMLACVTRVAQAVEVPVTADLEGAYGRSADDAAATARSAIEAGAVGLNFEDTSSGGSELLDIDLQADRITAMRAAATKLEVPLVINARTDVFLANVGDSDTWRLAEARRRSNRFLDAGADCAFVPGVTDEATITELVRGVHGPLNVLAGTATPPVKRLAELGVARVSLGSGAMGYALAQFRHIAQGLHEGGGFDFLVGRISHGDSNALIARRS